MTPRPGTPTGDPDDRLAVAAVRRGDRAAYGRLVDRYERRLFGLVLMMVREPESAEEVTQDAFVRAFTRLDLYDTGRPFYPWLATIAVRLGQSWLRRRQRMAEREGPSLDAEGAASVGSAAGQLHTLITEERDRALWRAVASLSSGQRTAVMPHFRQGLPIRDVAAALGVTAGTVKTLLFRARTHLRRRLETAADTGETSR